MIEWSSFSNYSVAECFPEKLSWCRNEQVCQEMKCFERSNGLDNGLYRNIPLSFVSF